MPVWLVAVATLLGSAIIADLPPNSRPGADDVLFFEASSFDVATFVGVSDQGAALFVASDAPSSPAYPDSPRFAVAESAQRFLRGPSAFRELTADVDTPSGAAVILEARGLIDDRWTEWREAAELDDLDGGTVIQLRATLLAAPSGASPIFRSARALMIPAPIRVMDGGGTAAPTARVWATRVGLVGRTTANGHVVQERDRFVALPSRRALSPRGRWDYAVRITYRGKTVDAPVWDVGPWNIRDDYWNANREQFSDLPRWTSQSEAAFFNGHNEGRDGMGRFITLPTSLDLADGTFWDDLGMTANDWVEVSFLWMDSPSPPQRATPRVIAKKPPTSPDQRAPTRSASFNAPTPTNELFLPLVRNYAGGWTTSWTVQNTATTEVTGATRIYSAQGTLVTSQSFSLPPFGSSTFSASDLELGLRRTFVGSAVVAASAPIAAVVNEDRSGSDRMAYEAFAGGGTSVIAPIVFKEYNGWSTGLQVQNLGGSAAEVEIEYLDGHGNGLSLQRGNVEPMASRAFYQPANADLPAGFAGSARVRSREGQPLAVLVNEARNDGSAMAYPGLAAPADRLEAPLLFKRYNGWDTGLQVFNVGDTAANVQVSYHGGAEPVLDAITIPAGSATTLYQPAHSALPQGFVGSALVAAQPGAQLVGVVNEVRDGPTSMNYALGQSGSSLLAVPLVAKALDGWDTGIQVRNAAHNPTRVSVVVYSEIGAEVHRLEDTIPGSSAKTFYAPGMSQLPAGFRGSAIVRSVTGEPLTAIVNEVGAVPAAAR